MNDKPTCNSHPMVVVCAAFQDLSAALPQGQVCHDEKRLEVIFGDLARHRDDSQQRSWALHEDHAVIAGYLEELLQILVRDKQSLCFSQADDEKYCIRLAAYSTGRFK